MLAARRKYFFAFCGIKQYPIILIGKKKYRYAFEKYEVSSVYLPAKSNCARFILSLHAFLVILKTFA